MSFTRRRRLSISVFCFIGFPFSYRFSEASDARRAVYDAVENGVGNGFLLRFLPSSLIVPNQKKRVYAIMGAWRVDSLNTEMPVFIKEEYFPTLIHEFNHSFCNELIIRNEELFKNSGEKLFEKVNAEMSAQGYNNWRTVLMEALVRASVTKYMKDHGFDESEVMAEINNQLNNKSLWIIELVAELDNYSKNRDQYPTLESYIPKLIDAYKIWAEKI